MLQQMFLKEMQPKKQKTYRLFALIPSLFFLFVYQLPADKLPTSHSEQYVIVESENGDRLTGTWRGATETHFEIGYQGQILRLPLTGYSIHFTSNLAHVADRTAAKYFRNGLMLLELGLPEKAKGRFEAAIEELPKYPAAHYQLGLLYKADGDKTRALERFRSVAILDAANYDLVPIFEEFGDTALANEAYAKAVDSYQLILTHYPEHSSTPALRYLTGFLLAEQLGDAAAGLLLLESAIRQHPDSPDEREKALFLIGKLQAETNQLEEALHTLRGFIMRYPTSEWVYEARLIRAETHLKLGKPAEAASGARLIYESSIDERLKERAKQIIDQTEWTIYTKTDGLPDNQIQTIANDETKLWIGTPQGIMLFETAYGKWISIENIPQLINSAVETVPDVRAIAVNSQEVWIGTRFQGAIHYNKLTSEIQIYSPIDGFPAWIRDIKVDATAAWFATGIGVIREVRGSINPPLVYNTQNSRLPANNLEKLLLTPERVWCVSEDGVIGIFDRKIEEWYTYHSTAIREEMTIVGIDTAAEQLLFTWFNADEKSNGYFRADLDGGNGKLTTLHTGIDDENTLRNIYIQGALDTSPVIEPPIVEENLEEKRDEKTETSSAELVEAEATEAQPLPPISEVPLVLWIATNDLFYTHHTRSSAWKDTSTPQIVSEALAIKSLVVANNRAWIATTNGLASVSVR